VDILRLSDILLKFSPLPVGGGASM